jgi:trimethylamine--corrinoid protein Co-methyltransferase
MLKTRRRVRDSGDSTGCGYDHFSQYRAIKQRSLNKDKLSLLHDASLEIMDRTGMRFHLREAVDLFRKAGAPVSDGNLVRIPPRLVEWALHTAPKNVTIFDQNGRRTMALGGYRSYFGPGSDCSYIYDLDTGVRRFAVLEDVVQAVRLVDGLPNFDFVMSMFLPSDVPEETYERRQMAIMLQESTKPIVFVGVEADSTVCAIDMAAAAAGGLGELQRYPFIVNYVNAVSAFQHNDQSLMRLLYAAERNLPSIYAPSTSKGTMAPITVAGAMALGNAGHLAGLVLTQLKQEGSPYLRPVPEGHGMDMRSMVSLYAAPDGGPFGADLAHYISLPTFGFGGCSDSKVFDAQAAAEAALTLFGNALGGVNLIHDVGYLDCAMTGSLEFLAFNDELIGWLRRYSRKLEISEETLALDLIHQIGPDGAFIETRHTLRHVREDWVPSLMDRNNYERWAGNGATTLQGRAKRRVQEILDNHRAVPLPEPVLQAIDEVVCR